MTLPKFIIVGAMRGGTTTIANLLAQHPGIRMPDNEVHFFSDDNKYVKGLEYYKSFFSKYDDRLVVGEKSATYHAYPNVAKRISQNLPNIKLIWVFRDPVKRLYSHYWHAVRQGVEQISLEKALREEEQRVVHMPSHAYLFRSKYVEHVKEYLKYFRLEQMYFVCIEEFNLDIQAGIKDIHSFLGALESDVYFGAESRKHVTSRGPLSPSLQYFVRRKMGSDSLVGKALKRVNNRLGPPVPAISSELKRQLSEYFSPWNEQLAEIIGRDEPFPWS